VSAGTSDHGTSRSDVGQAPGEEVGFIARADGALDWLPPGGGEEHGYDGFMATVDLVQSEYVVVDT
jgi:hypothetical protein